MIADALLSRIALAGCAVLALAAGAQTWRLAAEQRAHARDLATAAQYRAQVTADALRAADTARAASRRNHTAAEEAARHANDQVARARAAASAAVDTGQRLRDRIAAVAADCHPAGGETPAPDSRAATPAPGDLLADVQRRADAAAEELAVFADAASAAGSACEQLYDALTP